MAAWSQVGPSSWCDVMVVGHDRPFQILSEKVKPCRSSACPVCPKIGDMVGKEVGVRWTVRDRSVSYTVEPDGWRLDAVRRLSAAVTLHRDAEAPGLHKVHAG